MCEWLRLRGAQKPFHHRDISNNPVVHGHVNTMKNRNITPGVIAYVQSVKPFKEA